MNDFKRDVLNVFTNRHDKLKTICPVKSDRIIYSKLCGDANDVADQMYRIAKSMTPIKMEFPDKLFA